MKKVIVYVSLTLLSVAAIVTMCSGDGGSELPDSRLVEILSPEAPENPYLVHFDSMPPGGRRLSTYPPKAFSRVFNDSNYLHLQAADAIGIIPIECDSDVMELRRPIVKLVSCREYFVDDLTHSHPYLVPEAASLLKSIGAAFNDSLAARGGGDYRLKVTSVLRTRKTVSRLRRRNRNAVSTSAHLFGTTFDVSYSKFICDSVTTPRTQEDLKNLLAEILADFRSRGLCYIKYERKQSCFHITARPDTVVTEL